MLPKLPRRPPVHEQHEPAAEQGEGALRTPERRGNTQARLVLTGWVGRAGMRGRFVDGAAADN
jgi:hypothetical protein